MRKRGQKDGKSLRDRKSAVRLSFLVREVSTTWLPKQTRTIKTPMDMLM